MQLLHLSDHMHNPFVSMLHLFQSHRYYVALFFRALLQKPQYIFSSDIRQRIDWTPKAKVLFFLAWLLYLGIVVFFTITYSLNYLQILCISTLLLFLFPIYLVSVHRIIAPFQHIYVAYILQKAKFKLRNRSDLIVIAIVGSY